MDKDVEISMQLDVEEDADVPEITLPDCRNPETMGDPIPVMIDVSSSDVFASIYSTAENGLAIGLAVNGPNLEMTLEFLEYLLQ